MVPIGPLRAQSSDQKSAPPAASSQSSRSWWRFRHHDFLQVEAGNSGQRADETSRLQRDPATMGHHDRQSGSRGD